MQGRIVAQLRSPLLGPLFLILPFFSVLNRVYRIASFDPFWLLLNNLLLLLYLFNRFLWALWTGIADKPFGPVATYFKKRIDTAAPCSEVRELLSGNGFRLATDGTYAERRTIGHWGMILSHASLIVMIGFGSYDYFTEFSGSVASGIGEPIPLYNREAYRSLHEGYLQKASDIRMSLQMKRQALPSEERPYGASHVVLLSPEGEPLAEGLISPEKPLRRGPYEFRMLGQTVLVWFMLATTGHHDLFGGAVELDQTAGTNGPIFEGEFWDDLVKIRGTVRFDPYRERLLIEAAHRDRPIGMVELGTGSARIQERGGYRFKFESYGRSTIIAIVKIRHRNVRYAGLAFAACGALLWSFFRPKRVWIHPQADGCLIDSNDSSVLKRLAR